MFSRNILLFFNLNNFKLSTACDPLNQLHTFCDFEFKSTALIRDLQLCFIRINFAKTCFTIMSLILEFLIASFFGTLFGRDLVSSVSCFNFAFGNCMCCTCNYFMFAWILDARLLFIHLTFDHYHLQGLGSIMLFIVNGEF